MAFCQKCGAELASGAQFCASCGTPVSGDDGSVRKKVFVGEQRKCPHCGEILDGFTAVCPACGHDLNKKINDGIQKFSKELSERDAELSDYNTAHEKDKKKFWTDWSGGKKFGYVLLNIYTLLIPLILHFIFTILKKSSGSISKMNPVEKKKASLIMNFTVPNDRDGIMEFLNFATSQRDAEDQLSWKSVWNNKCQQIITKSKSIYSSDHHFVEFLDQKQAEIDTIKTGIKRKLMIPFCCLGVVIAAIVVLILVFSLGGGARVSVKERTVEKSEVVLIGGSRKLIDFTDSDIVVSYDSKTGNPYINVEVTANVDIDAVAEKQIEAAIAEKGWQKSDCKYIGITEYDTYSTRIKLNGNEASNSNDLVKSIISMKAGDVKKLKIKLEDSNVLTKSGHKKYAESVLTADAYNFEFDFVFEIRHEIDGKFDQNYKVTIK